MSKLTKQQHTKTISGKYNWYFTLHVFTNHCKCQQCNNWAFNIESYLISNPSKSEFFYQSTRTKVRRSKICFPIIFMSTLKHNNQPSFLSFPRQENFSKLSSVPHDCTLENLGMSDANAKRHWSSDSRYIYIFFWKVRVAGLITKSKHSL